MKVKVESEKVGLKLNIQKTKIMASGPITLWEIDGETVETVSDFIFLGSADGDCSREIKRRLLLGRKAMANLDSILKSRDITANKGLHSQSYGFSRSHGWMWEVDHKESWVLKNWCSQIVVLEKTLESPLDSKEVSLEYSLEGLMLKLKLQYFGHLIRKDPDAGKDWRQKEKGTKEDEMIGWHHWLNGCEFEQTQGNSEGQGSLACCSPWGCKESDMTEWLNSNNGLLANEHQGRKFIDTIVLVKEINLLWDPDSARPWLQRVRTGAEGNIYWTSFGHQAHSRAPQVISRHRPLAAQGAGSTSL